MVARLVLALVCCSCIGGRLGHQWRTDGTTGVYGGGWARIYGLDSMADVGDSHGLVPGAELDVLWSPGGHTSGALGGDLFAAGDPDRAFGYGVLAMIGLDVEGGAVRMHAALCATNYHIFVAGVCGRWVPGSWLGVDAELGVSVLGLAIAGGG